MMSDVCFRRLIAGAVCRAVLRFSTDLNGRLVERCERCERFDTGRCIDCAVEVGCQWPRPLRCSLCWRRQKHRIERRYSLTDGRRLARRAYEQQRYQREAADRREYARRRRVATKAAILRGSAE